MVEEKDIIYEQTRTLASQDDNWEWEYEVDYSPEEREKLIKQYEKTLVDYEGHQIVKGRVIAVDDKEVVVNIGFKSEGVIPLSEFRGSPVKVGDEIDVYLETIENKSGQLVLSRKMANTLRAWERINEAMEKEIVLEGVVKRRTKGGFVVDLDGIEAFLPGSQIDVRPIRDYDMYVGQRMEFKVVKINHAQNNVVISHKALIEKDLEAQKAEIINNLEKGQILEGTVKNITNFGVFIDLGGVDGLLHITDISWGRISNPEEVLSLDQKINVVVLDFDDEKKRISLGLKQLQPHPWDNLPENIEPGAKVKGKVVTIADYGIFIELIPGVEGLIHVSEMSWSQHPKNPYEMFRLGDEVEAVVLTLDKEERKMSLGIKQLTEDPWKHALEKYPVGSRHTGVVRNITNFGLFIELEEGIDGFVHVQDLSWSRKINHPNEFIHKDESLEVIVLEIDEQNRKLRLGHKQLTEDPWETLETVFPVDSLHKASIAKITDKGATVELEYGIEGFLPLRFLKGESAKELNEGDMLEVRVIEFNKELKKIVLAPYSKEEEERKAKKQAEKEAEAKEPNIYELPAVEVGTLGELAELASLKEEFLKAEEAQASSASPSAVSNEELGSLSSPSASNAENATQEPAKTESNEESSIPY
ncbi:MAG: 30S ribosomal protein S1 [Bacteroidia bacterium]|nr:30S ribosomal protein S1 [Bacteroidia bacterium]MDW8157838.1 30S ribosomal protein S1 [Bacteroidia bacterium]